MKPIAKIKFQPIEDAKQNTTKRNNRRDINVKLNSTLFYSRRRLREGIPILEVTESNQVIISSMFTN